MAELIPIEYRVRVISRQRVRRWALAGALVLTLVGLGLGYSALQERRSASKLVEMENQFQSHSTLIAQSDEIKRRRLDVADRMRKIEQLTEDHVLLALLHQIADGFSSNDCLEYIHIDARGQHGDAKGGASTPDADDHYAVQLNGMTTNTTTLAELMTRLSAPAKLPVSVMLEKSNRENVLDGQVVQFQITCEKGKGLSAG